MSNEVEIAVVTAGDEKSKQALKSVQSEGVKAADSINQIGATARGILSADIIGQIGEAARTGFTSARDAATDLGESMNAVNRIFGDSADVITKWGDEQANAYGLSQRAFNQMAVPIGASLKNVGLEMGNVARLTLLLTERASDMGSVFNHDVATVLEDIQAGLRGEADPLEKYGVGLNAAAVQQKALADSGKESAASLTNQEIMLARVNLLLQQTKDTMGDFKGTADQYANAQRIANAQIEEAQAKLGQAFLPMLAEAAKLTGNVADAFGKLPGPIQTTTAIVLGLGAAFVILAPKIVAAVDAFREIRAGLPDADTKMGKLTRTAVGAAATLGAIALASNAIASSFGTKLNPQIDAMADSMAVWASKNELGGEAARLFGKDLENLKYDLGTIDSGFWTKSGNAVAGFSENISGLGSTMDQSLYNATLRIQTMDSALAKLVAEGRTKEAEAAFAKLSQQAKDSGISMEDLAAAFPQYSSAQEKANKETKATTTQMQGQTIALKNLHDALRAQSDPLFALIDAQQNLKEKQKELNEVISKHGKESTEAQLATLELSKASIELSGAVADAQGKFDGKLTPAMKAALQAAGMTEAQIKNLEISFRNAAAAGDQFAKQYTATVTVVYREKGRATAVSDEFQSGVGGRQSGGYGSGWVVAGEHGIPELINLGASGRVYNGVESRGKAAELAQGTGMIGTGGSPADVNITYNFTGADQAFGVFFRHFLDVEAGGNVLNLNTNN